MARRQNEKLTRQRRGVQQGFSLPDKIDPPVPGMNVDSMDFVNTLLVSYRFASNLFDTQTPHHEDWIMLFVILTNEAEERATVTKTLSKSRAAPMARCAHRCNVLRSLAISNPINALAARSFMSRPRL